MGIYAQEPEHPDYFFDEDETETKPEPDYQDIIESRQFWNETQGGF